MREVGMHADSVRNAWLSLVFLGKSPLLLRLPGLSLLEFGEPSHLPSVYAHGGKADHSG